MHKYIVILSLFVLLACQEHRIVYQTGDLLFVEGSAYSAMDQAIMGSTGTMVHVGIIEVVGDSVFIIDAAPATGVLRRPLEGFLEAQKDDKGNLPIMRLMRLKDNSHASDFVAHAKSLCGAEYDFAFLPDNNKYYCSELVYSCYVDDGMPLFGAAPMNFLNAEGVFDSYWVELFEQQGTAVPQGVMGTNPQEMSQSSNLFSIFVP